MPIAQVSAEGGAVGGRCGYQVLGLGAVVTEARAAPHLLQFLPPASLRGESSFPRSVVKAGHTRRHNADVVCFLLRSTGKSGPAPESSLSPHQGRHGHCEFHRHKAGGASSFTETCPINQLIQKVSWSFAQRTCERGKWLGKEMDSPAVLRLFPRR